MEGQYSGVDLLRALQSAHNYNDYLTGLVRHAASSSDLIDFGAGIGTFSKRLREAGYHVVCIEPDALQRATLLDQGLEAFSDIDSVPDESASFIFSLNVFEHIEDDELAARQVRQKLKAGGAFLLYVPAFQCLWSSLDDEVCHHRRYTKTTLRRLVQRAGFSIETLRYADTLGFIVTLLFRLSRRSTRALTPASIRFYDRWIFPPSRVLDVLFNGWFGKNVFVLCRK
jgi:SAM-dependent methyltransferase